MDVVTDGVSLVDTVAVIVAALALLLGGAVAGVFFTYSNSVLPGLNAIRPDEAIRAMNSMNRKIINPLFLATFVGTPLVAAVAGVLLLVAGATGAALLFFGAALVYFLGAIVPTAAVNVPLNNVLDRSPLPGDEAEAARLWSNYAARWVRWNHWRAVFSLVALLLMGIGLVQVP
jgi:uncharacterized membrane protein